MCIYEHVCVDNIRNNWQLCRTLPGPDRDVLRHINIQ